MAIKFTVFICRVTESDDDRRRKLSLRAEGKQITLICRNHRHAMMTKMEVEKNDGASYHWMCNKLRQMKQEHKREEVINCC